MCGWLVCLLARLLARPLVGLFVCFVRGVSAG